MSVYLFPVTEATHSCELSGSWQIYWIPGGVRSLKPAELYQVMMSSGLVSPGGSKGRSHSSAWPVLSFSSLRSVSLLFPPTLSSLWICVSCHHSASLSPLLSDPSRASTLSLKHQWQPCEGPPHLTLNSIIFTTFLGHARPQVLGIPLEDRCVTCHMCGPLRWFGYRTYHSCCVETGTTLLYYFYLKLRDISTSAYWDKKL